MEDVNLGKGGTYLLDPKTGERKLLQRTQPAQPDTTSTEVVTDGTEDESTPSTGEDRKHLRD